MESEINSNPNNILQKAVFIILLIFSIHFWDLRIIPQKLNVENLLTWMVSGFAFVMVFQKSNMRFRNAILLFIVGLVFNALAAYINLGQSPKQTILSFSFYYFILLYFLLHYFEFDRKFMENIILVFALIYSVIFIIQYIIYPVELTNHGVSTATLEIQLEILGHGFLMLAYFLVFNRFLHNRRIINLILALLFFLILFKSGFRTLLAGAGVASLFMFLKMFKFRPKDFAFVILAIVIFIGLLQFKDFSESIDGMIHKTENEINLGSKFNRMIDIEFFFNRYPQNISYFIIGGGNPSGANLYNFNPAAMGQNYNIIWVDIGLLGFYIVIGGIATLGLLWYTLKAIFTRLPEEYLYLNFYFIYLLIVSFTNEEIYRDGIFSVHAIGLYLIDLAVAKRPTLEKI
jgi:hypothetical protein